MLRPWERCYWEIETEDIARGTVLAGALVGATGMGGGGGRNGSEVGGGGASGVKHSKHQRNCVIQKEGCEF